MKLFVALAAVVTVVVAGSKNRRGDLHYQNGGLAHGGVSYTTPYGHVTLGGNHNRGGGGHGQQLGYAYVSGVGGHTGGGGGGGVEYVDAPAPAVAYAPAPEVAYAPAPQAYAPAQQAYAPGPALSLAPEPISELPAKVSKSVYVFSAPPDPFDKVQPQVIKKFPAQRQKHYQVVFINAPNPPPPAQHTVELPQPPELKTQIYVLVKKPQHAPPVKIIPAKVPVNKPEVFFIRYNQNQHGGGPGGPGGPGLVGPGPVLAGGYGGPELVDAQGPAQGYADAGPIYADNGNPEPIYADAGPAPQGYASGPVDPGYGAPVAEYGSPVSDYGSPSSDYGPPGGSEYVTASGGGEYGGPGGSQGSYDTGAGAEDAYGQYSRFHQHYSTISGLPFKSQISRVGKSSSSGSSTGNGKSIKRKNDDKWIPIERDAGMSGI